MELLLRLLLLFLSIVSIGRAAEVPVATNPILTTKTVTVTSTSIATIGTTTTTSTPILCSDGSCIQITLVPVPILSTVTVLDTSVIVSTVGYTTLYSSVADQVSLCDGQENGRRRKNKKKLIDAKGIDNSTCSPSESDTDSHTDAEWRNYGSSGYSRSIANCLHNSSPIGLSVRLPKCRNRLRKQRVRIK
jgi:hypothetical protein